jgi:hypothetical protein
MKTDMLHSVGPRLVQRVATDDVAMDLLIAIVAHPDDTFRQIRENLIAPSHGQAAVDLVRAASQGA